MGIKGLAKLLADYAPGCCREQKYDNYFGRKIAIDASMHIYQALVVVGRTGDQTLTNEAGEVTSHIQNMFFRTAKMLESGMRPVYVFDGKPPTMKKEELSRRREKFTDATDNLEKAKEAGNAEDVAKYAKRTVRVTQQHNDECKRLLELMGVPIINAPSEAESQCAAMCKQGLVYAIATEDMDALTFATPRLIRNLCAAQAAKLPITEYEYDKVLEGLKLTADQFVDLCILCGCDYCGSIKGIGGVRAMQLIQKHGSLEAVMAQLDTSRYGVPDPFPFAEARTLFKEPDVFTAEAVPPLKWGECNEEGLVSYLVGEKNFSEERVRSAIRKLNANKGKSSQGRLESFFGAVTTKHSTTGKRKEADSKSKPAAKRGKMGGVGKKK
ncbi:Elongation of fatty acids protein 2 [Trebouxia sp. C0009 RCD-2024]